MNQIIEVTSEKEYDDALDNSTGALVVLYTAPSWCQPCRAFEPEFERLPELTDATLVRVDIDKNAWTGGRIMQVPTIQLFNDKQYVRNLQAASAEAFAKSITE